MPVHYDQVYCSARRKVGKAEENLERRAHDTAIRCTSILSRPIKQMCPSLLTSSLVRGGGQVWGLQRWLASSQGKACRNQRRIKARSVYPCFRALALDSLCTPRKEEHKGCHRVGWGKSPSHPGKPPLRACGLWLSPPSTQGTVSTHIESIKKVILRLFVLHK